MKICNKCGVLLDKFNTYKSIWKTKNYTCIKCCKKYKQDNNYKLKGLGYRKKSLKFRYGLTLEDFDKMYDSQDGKCAICKNPIPKNGRGVNIDHNHKTKKVRGLLCSGCNTFVGYIETKHILIPKVIEYIGMLNQ